VELSVTGVGCGDTGAVDTAGRLLVTVPIADEACGAPVLLVASKRENSRRPGGIRIGPLLPRL